MCVCKLHHWKLVAGVMHFINIIEVKSLLLSSPGEMIGEQYNFKRTAQPETIRHKRDLRMFIEPACE